MLLKRPCGLWKPPLGSRVNPNHTLARGMVACWLNNEGAPGTVHDLTGNGYDATWTSACLSDRTIVPGKYGTALKNVTNNANNGLTIPNLATGTTFTYALSVYVTDVSTAYQNVLAQSSSNGFWLKGGRLDRFFSGTDHSSIAPVSINTWVRWVYVCDAGSGQFFVDGLPDQIVVGDPGFSANGLLCDNGGSEQFTGTWSHSYLWNRALSLDEVRHIDIFPFDFIAPRQLVIPPPTIPPPRLLSPRKIYATSKPPVGTQLNLSHPLAKGLTGCWLLNESGGAVLNDISGNNNQVTLASAPTWGPNKLSFNGSSQFGYISSPPASLKPAALTVAGWVKANSLSGIQPVVAECPTGMAGDGRGYYLQIGTNASFTIGNSPGGGFHSATGASTLTTGKWYHLVGTYDGTALKVYVNGVLDGTTSTSVTISYTDAASGGPSPQTFYIAGLHLNASGQLDPANMDLLNGDIGYVYIYNRALSAAEVQQLYTAPFAFLTPRTATAAFPPTTTITRDWPFFLEYLATVAANSNLPVERLAGLTRDTANPEEYLSTAHADSTIPAEYLAIARADDALPLEHLGTVSITLDSLLPIDYLLVSAHDMPTPDEYTVLIRGEFPALDEYTVSLTRDTVYPLEHLTTVRTDEPLPVESLITLIADQGDALEHLLTANRDNPLTVEYLATTRADEPLPLEWKGGLAVTLDSLLPIEHLASFNPDTPVSLEHLFALRADESATTDNLSSLALTSALPDENLTMARADTPLPDEHLAKAATDTTLPQEHQTSVTLDVPFPEEWLSGLSTDAPTQAEHLCILVRDSLAPAEHLQALRADSFLPIEHSTGIFVTLDAPSPLEWLASVVSDETAFRDQLARLQADQFGQAEHALSVSINAQALAEWLSPLIDASRIIDPDVQSRTLNPDAQTRLLAAALQGRLLNPNSPTTVLNAVAQIRIINPDNEDRTL